MCACVCGGKFTRRCATLHLIFLPEFIFMEKGIKYTNREIHGLGNLDEWLKLKIQLSESGVGRHEHFRNGMK